MPARRKQARLVDRDYDILEHVQRYRLTTRQVLHTLFFDDSEPNAVTKVTSRLVNGKFLNRYDLHSGKSYFVCGSAAAKIFGLSPKKCAPLGPQALFEQYAILQFCIFGKTRRERLLVREVADNLPSLQGKGLRAGSFYLDRQNDVTRLAAMRVDHGAPSAHIVRKCRAELERLIGLPTIADLVQRRQFMFAIITSTDQKVSDIQQSLRRHTWPIPFRVEAAPDLAALLVNLSPSGPR